MPKKKVCGCAQCHHTFAPGDLLKGRYTPCCRSLWWWEESPSGNVFRGPKANALGCKGCSKVIAYMDMEEAFKQDLGHVLPIYCPACKPEGRH